MVKTAYLASGSDKLDSIEFNSAATGAAVGTAAFTDNTIFDNGTTNPASVHGCLVGDGTTAHCLYADHTTQDLFHDQQADGGAWGTDIERLDAVTVNGVSCNVYDRFGTKLAYVYDDGETVKYNEVDIAAAPGTAAESEDDSFEDDSVVPWIRRGALGAALLAANPVTGRRGMLGAAWAALADLLRKRWRGGAPRRR